MNTKNTRRFLGVAALVILAAIVIFAQVERTAVATLKDFSELEVRGAGFTLTRNIKVHIDAVGGGDKSVFRELVMDDENTGMYAYGWIIDAATREVVWEMTHENTRGRRNDRTVNEDVSLEKGAYEVYFVAYGTVRSGAFSYSQANIDRRNDNKRGRNFFSIFGDNFEDIRDEFMESAKNDWGITISVPSSDAGAVSSFKAPAPFRQTIFSLTGIGDDATVKKTLTVSRDVTVRIYALGEGRERDELYDHGWIIDAATRERVWDMRRGRLERAGGAYKNILADNELTLPKGQFELVYVTDDSHSPEDWNDRPPYDPFSYGITIFLNSEGDRSAVKIDDGGVPDRNAFLELTKVGDDEFKSMAFSLKKDMKVHVTALGERSGDRNWADYGWIVDARSREKVWSMDDRRSEHAGGASKNRMIDEIVSFSKGDYIVYYQTDDSHSYDDWNSGPPYDQEAWGIALRGVGSDFDPKSVTIGKEPAEANILAQIIRVRDDRHERRTFKVSKRQRVRIYALGEGTNDEDMHDYGWIENAESGRTIWEMTYDMTDRAGGARKNRRVSTTFTLEPGEYVLHYLTDDSHAFNEWNSDPPEDRDHWGITLYKEE